MNPGPPHAERHTTYGSASARGCELDSATTLLASSQHGIVTRAQLARLGISDSTIGRRREHGWLHRVHAGVYSVGHAPTSREALWMAAVLACGDGAALSHLYAATVWGIWRRRIPSKITVVTPHERSYSLPEVTRHRSRTLAARDVACVNAIAVTSVPRTLLDLGDVLTAHQLANVLHEAAFRRRLFLPAVREVMQRNGGRAALTVLARAIDLHESGSAGSRSDLEDAYLAALHDAGAPRPHVNRRLRVAGGAPIEVDLCWPRRRLVVEVDGWGHGRARTRREDEGRDRRLVAAGYSVVRVGSSDIAGNARTIAGMLGPRHGGKTRKRSDGAPHEDNTAS